MRNIFVIAERDFKTYFTSPIAYVVLTIFILLAGFFFSLILNQVVESSTMQAMQSAQTGQPPAARDMPDEVSTAFLNVVSSIMLFIFPMITMALFSAPAVAGQWRSRDGLDELDRGRPTLAVDRVDVGLDQTVWSQEGNLASMGARQPIPSAARNSSSPHPDHRR